MCRPDPFCDTCAMSDSDPTVPGPVPLPPTMPITPTLPDTAPSYPPVEPTIQMPVTTVVGAGGIPPITPPPTAYGVPEEPLPDKPWYNKPGPVLGILLVLTLIGGGLAWFFLRGGDDDVAAPDESRLVIEARDETGAPLDTGFFIGVNGPPGSELAFTWLDPADVVPGKLAGNTTGTDGRVDFRWQTDDTVTDPANWAATVNLVQGVPAGWIVPGPLIDCKLQRPDQSDSVVSMSAAANAPDPESDQTVTYTFPNYQFRPGDTVTCELTATRPVETTTTTTTIVETATTMPEETTTTTIAVPETTVPVVVTVPPQAEATLWDVIDNSPDLSSLKSLIQLAGLQDVLQDPNATLTLLAPSNEAIANARSGVGAPDFTNPAVVESILLTHLDKTGVLLSSDLLAAEPGDFVVVNPGPHAILTTDDGSLTVGGARVLVADVQASNGVLHVIDKVLLPQTLPD